MIWRQMRFPAAFVFIVCIASNTWALCGDVTGDGTRSASDALAVLRVAVGEPDTLVCTSESPSRLRYYNNFLCDGGGTTSTVKFNGFTFQASSGTNSDYQTVTLNDIGNIEVNICGAVYNFPGTIHLPANRSLSFWVVMLDPAVYQFPNIVAPAQFVVADEGLDPSASLNAAPMTMRDTAALAYGGEPAGSAAPARTEQAGGSSLPGAGSVETSPGALQQ